MPRFTGSQVHVHPDVTLVVDELRRWCYTVSQQAYANSHRPVAPCAISEREVLMQKIVTNLWFDGRVQLDIAELERAYRNE